MEARFGRIILQLVDKTLQEGPSRLALLNLLQLGNPSFVEEDLDDDSKRKSALRSLKLLIHPDKHSDNVLESTKRFQDTQTFYDQCILRLDVKMMEAPKKPPSPSSIHLPLQFHITDTWPFLADITNHPKVPSKDLECAETLEKVMGFKCINFRGAIAHGKKIERSYSYENAVLKSKAKSVQKVFEGFGGSKRLACIQDIKKEIMENGPVVSTSFRLTAPFRDAGDNRNKFASSRIDNSHAVLIVGWTQTACGEMWLVRSFAGQDDIPISVGQFSLEDEVLALVDDLSNYPWQSTNKAYDVPKLPESWYTWPYILFLCESERLEVLFKALKCSWLTALSQKKEFVIREEEHKARSRYAYLNDIEWVESKKQFRVSATFCDEKWAS